MKCTTLVDVFPSVYRELFTFICAKEYLDFISENINNKHILLCFHNNLFNFDFTLLILNYIVNNLLTRSYIFVSDSNPFIVTYFRMFLIVRTDDGRSRSDCKNKKMSRNLTDLPLSRKI